MIYIDMEMPDRCCNCPINFWNNCGLLDKISGHIENPSHERLPNCPLLQFSFDSAEKIPEEAVDTFNNIGCTSFQMPLYELRRIITE